MPKHRDVGDSEFVWKTNKAGKRFTTMRVPTIVLEEDLPRLRQLAKFGDNTLHEMFDAALERGLVEMFEVMASSDTNED